MNALVRTFDAMVMLVALTIFVVLSIFAILLLIPADPFSHRHVTVGVVLLVLDFIAILVFIAHLWSYSAQRKLLFHQASVPLVTTHYQQNPVVNRPPPV